MQTCTCLVRTSELQCIPLSGVTPAEAVLLMKEHYNSANGSVIEDAVLTDDIPDNIQMEVDRLSSKYGPEKVNQQWPGHNKRLPLTFAEINVAVAAKASRDNKTVPVESGDAVSKEETVAVKRGPGRPRKVEPEPEAKE